MDYETEEQQVEALKAWWAENGRAVIAGVVLGVGAIGGWTLWQNHQERQAVAASDAFSRAMAAVAAADGETVTALADELRDEYSGSLYAAYVNLAAARVAADADDLDAAAERLAWVAEAAPQQDVALIARLRLARVDGAAGRVEEGLARLPDDYPEAFTGLVEEARGDLHALAGDAVAARAAYEKARASGAVRDPAALTMKLNELAVAESAS